MIANASSNPYPVSLRLASESLLATARVQLAFRRRLDLEWEGNDWILGVTAPRVHEPVALLAQLRGVEHAGGSVMLDSTLGEGTVFRFTMLK